MYATRATCWPGTRSCTAWTRRAARHAPPGPAAPPRSRCSSPRCHGSAGPAARPSPPVPRWTPGGPSAGSPTRPTAP
ncbi:CxxxxCH/CxxCH domain-containing protein [Streptomyces sp. NPDC086033]|uniref:CxxxxCH/CxxCH domain-containing protein n=1 Tax=Streptomyces sp. NPDC086033 TaxID=3365747 RepID=UPI0037D7F220